MNSARTTEAFSAAARERLQSVGLLGIYLFSLFAFLGTGPATVGMLLFTLAFIGRRDTWRSLRGDRLALICVLYAAYVVTHSLVFYLSAPSPKLAADIAGTTWGWLRPLLFVPFAFWAAGREQRVVSLLLLTLIGFTLNIFRNIDWGTFSAAFFSTRFGANLPMNAFGMFTGLGILGLITMRERFWAGTDRRSRRWARFALWILLLAISGEGLLLSMSRGSWLAFAIAVLLLLAAEWRGLGAQLRRLERRAAFGIAGLFLAVVLGLLALNADSIKDRLVDVRGTVEQVAQGDLTPPPKDAGSVRLQAWRFGLEKWAERPWFGWGAGSSSYLIAHSRRAELRDGPYWLDHLHNTYLEVLVQLGGAGLILLSAMTGLLLLRGFRACRSGQTPGDLCRLFAVSFLFVLVWNLFEYRVVRHDWAFFWILFAGSAYSFGLNSRQGAAVAEKPDAERAA